MTEEEFDEALIAALESGKIVAVYHGIRIMLIAREHLKPHHAVLAPDEAIRRLRRKRQHKSRLARLIEWIRD
jgi:DNA repair photolyase